MFEIENKMCFLTVYQELLTIIFDVVSLSKVSKTRRNSVPVFFRHQRIIYFGYPKFKIYLYKKALCSYIYLYMLAIAGKTAGSN